MSKALVYVEGQTEEAFVKTVLAPHLAPRGLHVIPTLAKTKITKAGPDFKGGITSYAQVKRDLLRLLGDSSADVVTTMIDYYGLPGGFPGLDTLLSGTCFEKVAHIEEELRRDIGDRRFVPYLQVHEFEAAAFVGPEETARTLLGSASDLEYIRSQFDSPEEIDDGPETAPSKRLLSLFPAYQKPLHGPLITGRIGLERIRAECRHFDAWVTMLEGV